MILRFHWLLPRKLIFQSSKRRGLSHIDTITLITILSYFSFSAFISSFSSVLFWRTRCHMIIFRICCWVASIKITLYFTIQNFHLLSHMATFQENDLLHVCSNLWWKSEVEELCITRGGLWCVINYQSRAKARRQPQTPIYFGKYQALVRRDESVQFEYPVTHRKNLTRSIEFVVNLFHLQCAEIVTAL